MNEYSFIKLKQFLRNVQEVNFFLHQSKKASGNTKQQIITVPLNSIKKIIVQTVSNSHYTE